MKICLLIILNLSDYFYYCGLVRLRQNCLKSTFTLVYNMTHLTYEKKISKYSNFLFRFTGQNGILVATNGDNSGKRR